MASDRTRELAAEHHYGHRGNVGCSSAACKNALHGATDYLCEICKLVALLTEWERPLLQENEKLRETLQTIADFAVGHGDVCEIIARRARAALAQPTPEVKK